MMMRAIAGLTLLAVTGWSPGAGPTGAPAAPPAPRAPVRVVATLPVYASIVMSIGGAEVEVSSIADPNEDAHFVRPKPSFALDLRNADMFVTTGLDLELWVPALLDRAGNRNVLEGGRGYVTAYTGITLLDIPQSADRSQGDVHIYGNPHLHTDPMRTLQVARNITVGLKRVAPDRADVWDQGLATFQDRVYRATFGDRLVELLGGQNLEQLALGGNLIPFLEDREYQGEKLIGALGGWLGQAMPLRGQRIICYHKNWAYFEDRFGVTCEDYVEAKPGIPPTPRHVAHLIELMREEHLRLLMAASYFPHGQVQSVADRGGAIPVFVPLQPGAVEGTDDYVALVDAWLNDLLAAYTRISATLDHP